MGGSVDWLSVWDAKAARPTDFEATGRSRMDTSGFLYMLREIKETLDLHPPDAVLDIGCGTGIVALALAPWVARVRGIDLSPRMIERASRTCHGIPTVTFSVDALPDLLVEGTFDKVLVYGVLQYLPGEESVVRAVASIARVLNPGGRAMLAANPDPERKEAYRRSVLESEMPEAERSANLTYIDATLWLAPARAVELAAACGMRAEVRPLHPRIWWHFYMYNLLLTPA